MFEGDSNDEAGRQHRTPESGLRYLGTLRAQSYTAHAQLILEVWEHIACRMFDNQTDPHAERAAVADVATLLGISRASVHTMVDTVQSLGQIPGLRDTFTNGELDYAKVRTIVSVVSLGASAETCTLMAKRILRDARHLTPGPLRAAVWAAWMDTDTREAQKARARLRKYERKVYVRQGTDSMCWLSACLTDLEGAEAQILIDELATSVCDHDPRPLDTRRADALMALLHGEGFLRCQCDNPSCPLATAAPPKRRAHLLQILVGIETLLGLTADPATLPDGTPLDPDVVRVLAEDATWRAILTEMRTLATSTRHHGTGDNDTAGNGGSGDGGGSRTPGTDPTDESTAATEPDPAADSAPPAPAAARVEPVDTATEFSTPMSDTAPNAPETAGTEPQPEPTVIEPEATQTDAEAANETEPPTPDSTGPEPQPEPAATQREATEADPEPERVDEIEPVAETSPAAQTPTPDCGPRDDGAPTVSPLADSTTPDIGAPASPRTRRYCPVFLGIGRRHRPGILPRVTSGTCTSRRIPGPGIGELADELAARALLSGIPGRDDGHGGMTTPPPGALTYRPSAAVAALVRAAHPHCVFPGCRVPSQRCELDHVIEYDHTNPIRGGWTIPENLRPVCKGDHQLKTYRHWTPTLVEGGIAWRSRTGLLRFTPAADCRTAGIPTEPAPVSDPAPCAVAANPPLGEAESGALLYEPTWWETHMGENAPPPRPHDTELRERYREHRAIHAARERRRPPPF